MLCKACARVPLALVSLLALSPFVLSPALAGVQLEGSDISDPADPIHSPKTRPDVIGTGPVLNAVGNKQPTDRRVPPIVEPEVPIDAPGADVRVDPD